MELLLLIPILGLLILDYFIAEEYAAIARRKGFEGRRYFWWSFFLTVVGWGMVIALPDRCPIWGTEKPKDTTAAGYHPGTTCR